MASIEAWEGMTLAGERESVGTMSPSPLAAVAPEILSPKWGLGITLHDTKTVGYFLNLI
jgi:hypothetical protein